MKAITIWASKGGVGKTLLTYNLGAALANKQIKDEKTGKLRNRKVLLVDSDPQCNLSNCMRLYAGSAEIPNLYFLYEAKMKKNAFLPPETLVIKSPIIDLPSMDVLAGHPLLRETELDLGREMAREYVLKKYFDYFTDFFDSYDVILFDTSPAPSILNQNVIAMSDAVILPCDISQNGLDGVELAMNFVQRMQEGLDIKCKIAGLIVNNYDGRNRYSSDLVDHIKENKEELSKILFRNYIPRSVLVAKSELEGPLCITNPKVPAAQAFDGVIEELIERGIL